MDIPTFANCPLFSLHPRWPEHGPQKHVQAAIRTPTNVTQAEMIPILASLERRSPGLSSAAPSVLDGVGRDVDEELARGLGVLGEAGADEVMISVTNVVGPEESVVVEIFLFGISRVGSVLVFGGASEDVSEVASGGGVPAVLVS